jgi:hypothetical protein
LNGFILRTTEDEGWNTLKNGELLKAAHAAGFDILLTADQNLKYQNNLSNVRLGILVLLTPKWTVLRHHIPVIQAALESLQPNEYSELGLPLPPLRRRLPPFSKS